MSWIKKAGIIFIGLLLFLQFSKWDSRAILGTMGALAIFAIVFALKNRK